MGQASSAFVNILSFPAHPADACRTGGEGEEGGGGWGSDELSPEHHDDATSVEGVKDLRVPASASTPSMQGCTPGSARCENIVLLCEFNRLTSHSWQIESRRCLLQAADAVDSLEEGYDTSKGELTFGDTSQKSKGPEEGTMEEIAEAVVEAKDLCVPASAAASSMQGGTPGSARRTKIELKQAVLSHISSEIGKCRRTALREALSSVVRRRGIQDGLIQTPFQHKLSLGDHRRRRRVTSCKS